MRSYGGGAKYDDYWLNRRSELAGAIEHAAAGEEGALDVAGLGKLGQRRSWYGSATVQAATVVNSAMAHATSLARVVVGHNMCSRWPEKTFNFTISHGLTLAVVTGSSLPRAARGASRTHHRRPASPPVGNIGTPMSMDAVMACERVHALLESLPFWRAPSDVPFDNGLYFFCEAGERSQHAPTGRVVRVGNHPHTQDRLRGRLKDHFPKRCRSEERQRLQALHWRRPDQARESTVVLSRARRWRGSLGTPAAARLHGLWSHRNPS